MMCVMCAIAYGHLIPATHQAIAAKMVHACACACRWGCQGWQG